MQFLYPEEMEKILTALSQGKTLVIPTDTVYGLTGDALNFQTVKKIFQIKKRSFKKPLPLFVKSLTMAQKYAFINKSQEALVKTLWPGAVTAVLRARLGKLPDLLLHNQTIGLRVPNYPWLIKILNMFQRPLVATSANISGQKPSGKITQVVSHFSDSLKPDIIINGGQLPPRKPSVVLDLTFWPPKILRN